MTVTTTLLHHRNRPSPHHFHLPSPPHHLTTCPRHLTTSPPYHLVGCIDRAEFNDGLKALGLTIGVDFSVITGSKDHLELTNIGEAAFINAMRLAKLDIMTQKIRGHKTVGEDAAADDAAGGGMGGVGGVGGALEAAATTVPSTMTVVDFCKKEVVHWSNGDSLEENGARREFLYAPPMYDSKFTRWVNIEGLDALTMRQVAVRYGLDPLAIEDALHVEQRPKIDVYEHGMFIVIPMLSVSYRVPPGGKDERGDVQRQPKNMQLEAEAVSIFVVDSEKTVITVQEKPGDCWSRLREQLDHSWSHLRGGDHTFLVYSLMDQTVDSLFPVLHEVLEQLSALESQLIYDEKGLGEFDIGNVHNVKHQLGYMHRMLRPMREVLSSTERAAFTEGRGEKAMESKYLRDVHSHVIQLLEDVEEAISQCRDLRDLYDSKVDKRQSNVLYALTFVTILVTPIQLLSGVYGMNFETIPELEWANGYYYFWAAAGALMLLQAIFFKAHGWF